MSQTKQKWRGGQFTLRILMLAVIVTAILTRIVNIFTDEWGLRNLPGPSHHHEKLPMYFPDPDTDFLDEQTIVEAPPPG